MKWPKIKTWGDWCGRFDNGHITTHQDIQNVMQEEIDELRAASTIAQQYAERVQNIAARPSTLSVTNRSSVRQPGRLERPHSRSISPRSRSSRRSRPAWSATTGRTVKVVTPDSASAASRSSTWPSGLMSHVSTSRSSGTAASASSSSGQVQVLDPRRGLRVANAAGQVVVEVAAARAHPADVQGAPGTVHVAQVRGVVADRHRRADVHVQRPQGRVAGGEALAQRRAPHVRRLLRHVERAPALGQLGGQLHVARADGGHRDRDAVAQRVVDVVAACRRPAPASGGSGTV